MAGGEKWGQKEEEILGAYYRGDRQEEKGMTEGEMAGWHHRLNGHEFK